MKYKVLFIKIYKTIKDPLFIVAFVISFLLLLFTKLGDKYIVDITIPIEVEGVEIYSLEDKNVNIEDNHINIGLKVRGTGYRVLQTYLYDIKIPAESFVLAQDSGVYNVDMGLFERTLSSELKDLEILKIFNRTIPIKSVVNLRKEVPVRNNITLDLSGEYMQVGEMVFEPSKVWVAGSKRDLDNIEYVNTAPRVISDIDNHVAGVVPLKQIANVAISNKDVYYSVNIERFTEYTQDGVGIQIKGLDAADRYITLPSAISVTYNMTRDAYKDFNHSNVVYYADISDRDSNRNYLGDNKYRILYSALPSGVEVRSMSSEFVTILKSK